MCGRDAPCDREKLRSGGTRCSNTGCRARGDATDDGGVVFLKWTGDLGVAPLSSLTRPTSTLSTTATFSLFSSSTSSSSCHPSRGWRR